MSANDLPPSTLIVEEAEILTELIMRYLNLADIETHTAHTTGEALKFLQAEDQKINCMILGDVHSALQAHQLLATVRNEVLLPPGSIICISTHHDLDRNTFKGFGCEVFISKPFGMKSLIVEVQKIRYRLVS